MINKDDLKNNLSIEEVYELLVEFRAEPVIHNDVITARTICHHHPDEECSMKLYYYDNTKLFKCYTGCAETSFDIFALVQKYESRITNSEWSLPRAISFVARYYGVSVEGEEEDGFAISPLEDWKIFKNYKREPTRQRNPYEYRNISNDLLQFLPTPRIKVWEDENISKEVMQYYGICYDPVMGGIVIPHYDIDGNLIGVRERTLDIDKEEFGKYKPAIINNKMYNHPLGYNLYGLNFNKEAIKTFKTAIVFESEKAVMMYATLFGIENNISVAACGSNISIYQIKLLLNLGVQEIIIAFDRESSEETKALWVKKFYNIHNKYSKYVKISFIYDKTGELLELKDSPIDKGKDIFLELLENRITL